MSIEVKVPVLPESVSDATIATWHKKVGDAVKRDENLVDLETDKVVLEVPSPVDGVLKEIKFAEGDDRHQPAGDRGRRGRRRRRRRAGPGRKAAIDAKNVAADHGRSRSRCSPRPPRRSRRRSGRRRRAAAGRALHRRHARASIRRRSKAPAAAAR